MPGKVLRKKTAIRALRARPTREIVFVMHEWADAYNVGGMFRSAAACGAAEIIGIGKTPLPPNPMIGVTSMGMHRSVPFRSFPKWDSCFEALRSAGHTIVAVEISEGASPYLEFEWPAKVALVLGSEGAGLPDKLALACDAAVYIPMFGKGRSLNVQVAAAIVGFQAALASEPLSPGRGDGGEGTA